MRSLLVNPWIYDFAAYDLWSKPLGLLTIASYLKELNVDLSLIDCLDRFHPRLEKSLKSKIPRSTIFGSGNYYSQVIEKPTVFKSISRRFKRYGLPKGLFIEIINEEPQPDIILVTCGMTYWYPGVFEAIKILRHRFHSVPILLGGIYARLCFKHVSDYSKADFVYNGNNVLEILDLIGRLTATDFDYALIDKKGPVFAAYELYPRLSYVTLRTSSGCPFKCSYCGWYLLEKDCRQDDPDFIVSQIGYFYRNRGIKNFSFYDDALLYNADKHIVKILKGVVKRSQLYKIKVKCLKLKVFEVSLRTRVKHV